jgi:hypothetical protein
LITRQEIDEREQLTIAPDGKPLESFTLGFVLLALFSLLCFFVTCKFGSAAQAQPASQRATA